jgi:hypothetical protein
VYLSESQTEFEERSEDFFFAKKISTKKVLTSFLKFNSTDIKNESLDLPQFPPGISALMEL